MASHHVSALWTLLTRRVMVVAVDPGSYKNTVKNNYSVNIPGGVVLRLVAGETQSLVSAVSIKLYNSLVPQRDFPS
jgi:hypothetical protein